MTDTTKNIVYRGTLTLEKLKELSDTYLKRPLATEVAQSIQEAEQQSDTASGEHITLRKMSDGNWTGERHTNGKTLKVRDISPEYVLQRLMTHNGVV